MEWNGTLGLQLSWYDTQFIQWSDDVKVVKNISAGKLVFSLKLDYLRCPIFPKSAFVEFHHIFLLLLLFQDTKPTNSYSNFSWISAK